MSRARDFADLAGSAQGGGITGANALINGQFAVAQRATSFVAGANNDTNYTLDRWKLFSDGNDVVDVTQETSTVPTNRQTAIALDVETANKKFGIAQIIEQKNCVNFIGKTVTLSFQAKVSATTNLDNIKAAIIAWDGTADTVTADMISAWGVEGTNPTLATNFTYENTPANLNLTTSYATYSVTASVDTASAKNIIVFIFSDVTTTSAGEFLYITDVKLEAGQAATPFEHEDIGTTLRKCQRYYYRIQEGGAYQRFGTHQCVSSGNGYAIVHLPVSMRQKPSLHTTGTASNYAVYENNGINTCSSLIAINSNGSSTDVINIVANSTGNLAGGNAASLLANNSTTTFLGFKAEL